MVQANYPKGAGLGRDPNPRTPSMIDFGWTMRHGSRAQRREILRSLRLSLRGGVPGAADALHELESARVRRAWLVTPPRRNPFIAVSVQGATADEVQAQWPGAVVEVPNGH